MGKISGAVGAHNAQLGLGISTDGLEFERHVLLKLGIGDSLITTQIVPPEPLADYLFSVLLLSATLGQFGRDGRNLMRTEIGELAEPFEVGQVGSSTMAHKRNPITFENIEGMWIKNKSEFGKVLDTLISDHQRDLVGSSISTDYPIMVVNLVEQLSKLLSPDKLGDPFIKRIIVDEVRCARNLEMEGDAVLAEPLYLALQLYGYQGDAHKLVNEVTIPAKKRSGQSSLLTVVEEHAKQDDLFADVWSKIPDDIKTHLGSSKKYIGVAVEKTRVVCALAQAYRDTER